MNPFRSIAQSWRASTPLALAALSMIAVGCGSGNASQAGGPVDGGKLVPAEAFAKKEVEIVQGVAERIAKEKKIDLWMVKTEDIQADPAVKKLGLGEPDFKSMVDTSLTMDADFMSDGARLSGFKKVNFDDDKNLVLGYAVPPPQDQVGNAPDSRKFRSFKDAFKGKDIVVFELKVTNTPPPPPTEKGKPAPTPPKPSVREMTFGPIEKIEAEKQMAQVKQQNVQIEVLKTYPAFFYSNDRGRLVVAVEGDIKAPHRMTSPQMLYFMASPDAINKLQEAAAKDPTQKMPPQRYIPVAIFQKG